MGERKSKIPQWKTMMTEDRREGRAVQLLLYFCFPDKENGKDSTKMANILMPKINGNIVGEELPLMNSNEPDSDEQKDLIEVMTEPLSIVLERV